MGMTSNTPDEEAYAHLVSSSNDLDQAWRVLHAIASNRSGPLTGAAFMFSVIAYARPYTTSRGEFRRYTLDLGHVPPEHRALHDRLMAARHKILAHSDLTVKEARVHVANMTTGKYVGVVQNILYGTELLSELEKVTDLVEKTLASVYEAIKVSEANLPPNT
jgi:hypothetical protein